MTQFYGARHECQTQVPSVRRPTVDYQFRSRRTEQSLNNPLPNTKEQQVLIRATGTKNPVSDDLHYAVNRRVAGSSPARGAKSFRKFDVKGAEIRTPAP